MDMLKGVDYVYSRQKREFDRLFAALLTPSAYAAERIAKKSFIPPGNSVLFRQARLGRDGAIFDILKICTLDEEGIALSSLARVFRKNGFDELSQVQHIREGEMSVVGRRPITEEENIMQYEMVGDTYEGAKLVDQHRALALPTRPGALSTYVLAAHRDEAPVDPREAAIFRLSSEIDDIHHASLPHDLSMIAHLGASVLEGKMNQTATSIRPEKEVDII